MMRSLRPGLWLVGLLALAQVAPARVQAWAYLAEAFQPASRHAMRVVPEVRAADLDGAGPLEEARLAGGRAEIWSGGVAVWQSPAAWQVRQAAVTDVNRDGRPEVTLLVWRQFAQFPVDRYLAHPGRIADFHDAAGQSCHLILIGWARGQYRELWAGSAMSDPFLALAAADVDGDGRQDLVALEGQYSDAQGQPARALTAWAWNGFGFTLLARAPGRFGQLAVAKGPRGQTLILTQE